MESGYADTKGEIFVERKRLEGDSFETGLF